MKKRFLSFIVSSSLLICMTACGDSSSTTGGSNSESAQKAETWQTTTTTTAKEEKNELVYDSSNFSIYYWGTDVHIVENDNDSYVKINFKVDNKTDNYTSLKLDGSDVDINGMDISATIIGNPDEKSSKQGYIYIEGRDLKNSRIDTESLKEISFTISFEQTYVDVIKLKVYSGYRSIEKSNKITVKI